MRLATTLYITCVGLLFALGMVMLYSAGVDYKIAVPGGAARFFRSQLIFGVMGIAGCIAISFVDYRWLKKYSWLWLLLSCILLVLVFVPHIGYGSHGAKRWIKLHGETHFQPSELAKIALLIALAYYCEINQRKMCFLKEGLVLPGIMVGAVLLLIFKEPDWGTTFLLVAVSGSMLVIAGARLRYLIPVGLAGAIVFAFLLFHNPVRLERFKAWINPSAYKETTGYQVDQSITAIGTGGWFGVGLGNGRQKVGGFVPEHQTDFILSVIGEELGLVATLGVLALFVILVLCGAHIASNARDKFGFFLGAGLTVMLGTQACINVGVVTGALINKGLPLPFISYGGSNLIMSFAVVGLMLSIARHAGETSVSHDDVPVETDMASVPF